jgi:aspartyl-tRNA(Asn)/glutamyl-tRNA(Gln) amidotransferase subunit B
MHLEEDAGKLVHPPEKNANYSLADYNRGSSALLEIVTGPDMRSIDEALSYCSAMRQLLKYLNVCEAKMELGQIRFEANISVRKKGTDVLNTRIEIKNLNSFKTVERAMEYEIERQIEAYETGEKLYQETRLFDEEKGITMAMRSKEDANDYRYFPDPDLPPVVYTQEELDKIKAEIGELPLQKRNRFMSDYELSKSDADFISAEIESATLFDETVKAGAKPKIVANWIMGEIARYLNDNNLDYAEIKLSPALFADLLKMIDDGKINAGQARQILTEMLEDETKKPADIAAARGFEQISDSSAIETIVDEVIAANADAAEKYKNGEDKPLAFLVGQVMRASKGKANAGVVNEIFEKKLRGA